MISSNIDCRIGISTHFLPSTHGEDIIQAARMVAEAGFAGFEIVPSDDQAQLGFPQNYANVGIDLWDATLATRQELRRTLELFDWVTIHAPHLEWNLSSANRHLRRITSDYFDACLEYAIEIGAAAATFHLGNPTFGYIRQISDVMKYNVEYAAHAIERAQAAGMPVGFEAGGLDALRQVCQAVPGWGMHLDIGHAYMSAGSDAGFQAYIDQLGDRIVEIHHNGVNQYWGQYMEHQPPHLNNTIDYYATYRRLKEIGYKGPIVCEIQGQDIAQVIEHCLESKRLITAIWNDDWQPENRWSLPG
ncbi:MAG: sugar phosphate isomerase/epimerase family protein [Armatimonadota bacterium]